MTSKILYLFTHTPLHVGAGASVGAIDQPIQRERHTGFPIIPASSLKGSFADQWPVTLRNEKDELARVRVKKDGDKHVIERIDESGAAWLFGSDDAHVSFGGALIFAEARVLAFPIRSAKGSYAWITCPLMLQRAARDGVFGLSTVTKPGDAETNKALVALATLTEPKDTDTEALAIFKADGPLALGTPEKKQVVLEEYCFNADATQNYPTVADIANALAALVPNDPLFDSIKERLVILSNGMMSHFAATACEIAQHVRISDETGTADPGGLFNQENVPADTLFYSVLSATDSRVPKSPADTARFHAGKAADALAEFGTKVEALKVFQFGGDASTGLGFCSACTNIETAKKGA